MDDVKADRQSSSVDVASKTLTMTAADGSAATFDLAKLPDAVMVFLAGRGAAQRLGRVEDPAAEWAKLVSGDVKIERSAKTREPSLTDQAIALGIRDELAAQRGVKKSDKAAYAELLTEAQGVVAGMDKPKKMAARQMGAVLSHIAALKGASAPAKSLLDIAA